MNHKAGYEDSSRVIKVIYKNEIHKLSKIPSTYQALVESVTLALLGSLPEHWHLVYEDSEKDFIMLKTDDDFHSMMRDLDSMKPPTKTVKIYVRESDQPKIINDPLEKLGIEKAESVIISRQQVQQPIQPKADPFAKMNISQVESVVVSGQQIKMAEEKRASGELKPGPLYSGENSFPESHQFHSNPYPMYGHSYQQQHQHQPESTEELLRRILRTEGPTIFRQIMPELIKEHIPMIATYLEDYISKKGKNEEPKQPALIPNIEKDKKPEELRQLPLKDNYLPPNKVDQKFEEQKVEIINGKVVVQKPQIQYDKPLEELLEVACEKELFMIPARVTVNDKAIYKTVFLKNTGKVDWPEHCVAVCIEGGRGQELPLSRVTPGKDLSAIFVIENPGVPGSYKTIWSLAFYDDKRKLHYAGKPFSLSFEVCGYPDFEKNGNEKKPIEEKKPVEDKKLTQREKAVLEKVSAILEILPDTDRERVHKFVDKNLDMNLEELLDQLMG